MRLPGIEVVVTRGATGTVVELHGDLETTAAWDVERLLDSMLRDRPPRIEVSLEALEFLDSSGLRVFLVTRQNAQRLGIPLIFSGARGAVRRTLDFAKALDYLGIVD